MRSQMMKADIYMVESALEKMAKIDEIKKFGKYFISTLYEETLSYHFNEGCENRNIAEQIKRDFGYPA